MYYGYSGMVIECREFVGMFGRGTIIDLETVGRFSRQFDSTDSRQYAGLRPTIFGYLSGGVLVQYCAEGSGDIPVLVEIMNKVLPTLEPPFYALNCNFERGVCSNSCTCVPEPLIDVRGVNSRESKWKIRARLGIPTYDDPFNGVGYTCIREWENENYTDCLKHNRACLLIERDILDHNRI